ncbi:MAG: nitrous oxide reductase family maturation protein NosD [Balneolaceae bacterium]
MSHFFCTLLLVTFLHSDLLASERVIEVRTEGPVSSLTEALELAYDGDEIRVYPGTYPVHDLQITKSVVINGIDYPVLDGGNLGHMLVLHADNIEVRGFIIQNSGSSQVHDYSAILSEKTSGAVIEGNRFIENFFDIYIADSDNSLITGNMIEASERRESLSANGIHLWNSRDFRIVNNTIHGKRDGIYLEFVLNGEIHGNISENNVRYGLHFMFSDDSEYDNNQFRKNGAGVAVMYSKNVKMTNNIFEKNWGASSYGLLLKEMNVSEIANNIFYENTVGIFTEGSHDLEIYGNDFELNGWAVKIYANSTNNRFLSNNFIENTFDVGTRSLRHYNHFEGNYWSHYEGYDMDRDGVGDVPYRPVRLFSILIERRPEALILLRSMMIRLLDMAERVMPVLTPETLVDEKPRMQRIL